MQHTNKNNSIHNHYITVMYPFAFFATFLCYTVHMVATYERHIFISFTTVQLRPIYSLLYQLDCITYMIHNFTCLFQ